MWITVLTMHYITNVPGYQLQGGRCTDKAEFKTTYPVATITASFLEGLWGPPFSENGTKNSGMVVKNKYFYNSSRTKLSILEGCDCWQPISEWHS